MPTLSPKAEDQRKRLDRFLSEAFPEQSRSQIQRWIDDQQVLLDGKPAKAGYKLRGKEQIEVSLPEAKPSALVPEAIPLEIVYEDADLAVINKPAGMVVHIGAGVHQGTLVNACCTTSRVCRSPAVRIVLESCTAWINKLRACSLLPRATSATRVSHGSFSRVRSPNGTLRWCTAE